MGNKLTSIILVAIILATGIFLSPPLVSGGEVFVTWDGLEVDKLASMWLIQRHISPDAIIRIIPKGAPMNGGIPFDVPEAGITRTFNQSSFDSLMAHYRLQDPRLRQVARLIRDIELSTWEIKRYKKSSEMEAFFYNLIETQKDRNVLIEKSNIYFDELYHSVSGGLEENAP